LAEHAPFYHDLAEGPKDADAYWLNASDGVRLRAALWPIGKQAGEQKGTVLLFTGRTECVEKYGRVAQDLAAHGFAMASIDWRGQGLSDRVMVNPAPGHVGHFLDYQKDAVALLDLVREQGLPEPYFMIAHSMGGAIGLRSLMNEFPVQAAAFSAPMWGISISPHMRALAWTLSSAAHVLGLGHLQAPATPKEPVFLNTAFEDNDLTTDPEQYDYICRQIKEHPELGIAGPTLHWLRHALIETRDLRALPGPELPALAGFGSKESIVDVVPAKKYIADWPSCSLLELDGAYHELLMESAPIRSKFIDQTVALFTQAA